MAENQSKCNKPQSLVCFIIIIIIITITITIIIIIVAVVVVVHLRSLNNAHQSNQSTQQQCNNNPLFQVNVMEPYLFSI